MIELEIIKSKIKSDMISGSKGRHCHFVKITDTIGAKLYDNRADRTDCYNNQSKAAEYDLGPETYGEFAFETKEDIKKGEATIFSRGSTVYGYLTEIVEVGVLPLGEYGDYSEYKERRKWFEETYEDVGLVEELQNELGDIGFEFTDYANFNVGIKNGALVCIDFGR